MKPSHIAACGVLLAVTCASQAFAAEPLGVWMDDSGRGAVEIKPCGKNLCGYVVAVKNANDTKGCGKQIIGDAKPAGGGVWSQGWIYSPERKKNYDVELKPLTNGTLRVIGYAGTKLFSRTMIWTAAPADLKRCDTEQAATPSGATEPAAPPLADAKPAPAAPVAAASPREPVAQPRVAPPAHASPTAPPRAETPADQSASQPPAAPAEEASSETTGTSGDDTASDAGGKREGFRIGDLDLEKVLTRTPNGKCKLDLPWVNVEFKCGQD